MPHERSAQRVDQANGYKSKTMLTRMGEITFEVPQVRSGGFYPSLAVWAEENLPEGFALFGSPPEHRVRMRTTKGVERLNKEIKRRKRVATLFANLASCLRLVSAILAEHDKKWMSAKIYLTMKP